MNSCRAFWATIIGLLSLLAGASASVAAESAESLIAGAKKEDEIIFVAGAQTFGGRKGLADLEAAFNNKFGLKARISFAAGPDMNARARATSQRSSPAEKFPRTFFSARNLTSPCCTKKMLWRR